MPTIQGQSVLQLASNSVNLRIFGKRALAGNLVTPVQRSQDLHRAHHASPVVRQPDGVLGGSAAEEFLLAGHAEVPALGLTEDVVGGAHAPRPPAAETTQPAIHQPGIDFLQLPVADTPTLESARAVVLHHHVGLGCQFLYDVLTLFAVEVNRDEVLVGVGTEKSQTGTALRHPARERIQERLIERRGMAHGLAPPGRLNLDDLGAELRHVRSAGRAKYVLRAREHAVALKRLRLAECLLEVKGLAAELFKSLLCSRLGSTGLGSHLIPPGSHDLCLLQPSEVVAGEAEQLAIYILVVVAGRAAEPLEPARSLVL